MGRNTGLFSPKDPWGWPVTEYEEAYQLVPGLESIAQQITGELLALARDGHAIGISHKQLVDNPYWPRELASRAGALEHERFVLLLPLALSRTQDDKGRVRWTVFGSSEQGPSWAFWRGFYASPHREIPREQALDFFVRIIRLAYGAPLASSGDLHDAGFRILLRKDEADGRPPGWVRHFTWRQGEPLDGVRYLLTFVPFAELAGPVQQRYFEGRLHLLPFPGSMLFWGARNYAGMQKEHPFAMQIPLLHALARHEGPQGLRVPQSGWMHEPGPGNAALDDAHGPVRNTYIRTHRWARVHRHEDEIAVLAREDKLMHVLFSSQPEDVELYGKPMARNAQIWTSRYHFLFDGPRADRQAIVQTLDAIGAGGTFGYRFQFPAMRVGVHEVYWHRPLTSCLPAGADRAVVVPGGPAGYLTAYSLRRPGIARPVELWPRLLERAEHLAAAHGFEHETDGHPHQTALNVRKLLEVSSAPGFQPLPRAFARSLLTLGKRQSLDEWLASLPARARDPEIGERLSAGLNRKLVSRTRPAAARSAGKAADSLTFAFTATRAFETRYWNAIRTLSHGAFVNKCNADCVQDPVTHRGLRHHHRDLEALGDYLLAHYRKVVSACGLGEKALVGELPFRWETDFDFSWAGGWLNNQQSRTHERNLLVVIPGRNRRRAVVMADHYDTAYMEDVYDKARGGSGARLAAAGADDNHSATAALMLAAPIFCRLSREGKLGCDVWLLHLTGEEFPSDCMGARRLCSSLVERSLKFQLPEGRCRDLSKVRVQGVYVLDMVAHNNDHARDIFQIAPGTGQDALRLAYLAHQANESWNEGTEVWNRRPSRRGRGRSRRSPNGSTLPPIAGHPALSGEVRLPYDPRSTLYNTDGQIFSDAGIPVVLFMENYDINRTGYHDSHDTMANIDLDYGAAVAAIAIESVARASAALQRGRTTINGGS